MSLTSAAVVLDHTALLELGRGNRLMSGLVSPAHRSTTRYVYVPALCLAAATAERPALGDHIGALPALTVVDLGFASGVVVGRVIAAGADWRAAHAAAVARPDPEWPNGRPIITVSPDAYDGLGVSTVALS